MGKWMNCYCGPILRNLFERMSGFVIAMIHALSFFLLLSESCVNLSLKQKSATTSDVIPSKYFVLDVKLGLCEL